VSCGGSCGGSWCDLFHQSLVPYLDLIVLWRNLDGIHLEGKGTGPLTITVEGCSMQEQRVAKKPPPALEQLDQAEQAPLQPDVVLVVVILGVVVVVVVGVGLGVVACRL
jgi:hypothetical protein